ncbi:MAG: serine hydrolase [Eubacteriales bacterium]|nr:serine hydrolase [Eubacteriales bacterium]MDD3882374.1 serine hydrolase [Eubacteriales bacterium]MDD4512405.1 serine hydrolase [Eubacteriales bacterium]
MKKFVSVLLALVLTLVCCFSAFAQEVETEELTPEEIHEKRQKIIDKAMNQYDAMGGVVIIIKNGAVDEEFYFGYADKKTKTLVDEYTAFKIASITKMVTAIGVLQLVESGKLDLDADLSKLFGFTFRNPYYKEIPLTLRMLMTHTTGLNATTVDYNKAIQGKADPTLEYMFSSSRAKKQFLKMEPGSKYSYSNLGGGMLGSIIELCTGMTIDEYMTKNVFEPLGINAHYQAGLFDDSTQIAKIYNMPKRTLNLDPSLNRDVYTEPDWQHDFTYTAGGLIISGPDLAKILIMLCDGGEYNGVRLLKQETVAEMTTLQNERFSVSGTSDRGLNMNIITDYQVDNRTMYGHQGKAYEMLCAAYFDPTDRSGVVVLSNGCDNTNVRNYVNMFGRIMMKRAYEMLDEDYPEDAK